ncbi:conjugal transfer protein TrbI (plasmid) [Campylobacter fetus]|uniref:Conjugal transfer protein TrbI n=1 Tax=Campylobacter fetus TaxID=196 RepID=A0A974MRJ7_CAMFE|nr:TrbI/VirB10 family protein [Campylobacter fetus]OCS32709.1 conjugal transfer protein TrbI [Campylobacter fetus subsp. venerealis]KAA3685229.1 conjugal transfer protein TrbI [Campylobacter fetus subsp. fetus]OCS19723.1 conjugal transfer protein TrbI [Campylobacter fetus subsp. venerealis cfvi03/596]OCS23148.1 conjugal transfer protein TrbI [Campylobacter fetus subsp. venerealis cfvi9825]QMS59850.1 conjugal transfer protein TrbI [Campylobacter fetus]
MSDKNLLEICTSPEKLSNTGNKRLSKVPILIIAIIVILVLFAVFYTANDRAKKQAAKQTGEQQEEKAVSTTNKDINSMISSLEAQGIDTKTQKNIDLPVKNVAPELKNDNIQPLAEYKPIPTLNTQPKTEIDEREIRLKQDMRLKALASKTGIEVRNSNSIQPQTKDSIYQEPINLQNEPNLQNINNSGDNNDKFLSKLRNNGYLEQVKQKPISAYEIKAGWNIPAVLITGVNSELPGQILAQITQNVYDTATGKYLLIPQGTKVVGDYSNNVIYGQSRLLVAWNKIIFPNGDTLNIGNMQGASMDGYTGFEDQVDNHYFRIFGSAFLLSSITAGIALSDNSQGNQTETARDKAIGQAIQQMGQVASEMIRKNMNISPTLIIRPGYKFNIFVTKDIVLEPLELKQ